MVRALPGEPPLPHTFEWPFPDYPLQATVIPAACAPFSSTLFPSTFLLMCFDTAL